MKRAYILLIAIVFLSFSNEKQKHQYDYGKIKCTYETSQGRIDGDYVSYYKNGQKKAEGKFGNNYRSGLWTVWDSTGRIRMQRQYENPFTFKRIIPAVTDNKLVSLLNVPRYDLKYNSEGFIDYFKLEERMAVVTKRLWRTITPAQNPLLFENNRLFRCLNKNILNKNITVYDTKSDEFLNKLSSNIDTSSVKVIGYKIKEDWFFDNERLVSESRILGLCPVVVNKQTKDTLDFYWAYFPEIRKYLSKEKISSSDLPTYIKTLDDLFFYRFFSSQIYKESNVHDRTIASYKKGKEIEKEAERIEIGVIESEHDLWISFTK